MAKKKKISRARPVKKHRTALKAPQQFPAVPIEFCHKCSSIMIPVKKGKSTYLRCRSCGSEKKRDVRVLKIIESVKKRKGVIILEKDSTPLPLTEKMCPQCEHPRSYWCLQQTRSADEPPTQFFRCEKCKHTWREYK